MIYDRVVQWVSGPFAIVVGGVATKLVANWNFLGQIGLGKSTTAHYITDCIIFVTSSGVTYLAHHKWLDNLAKWWTKETGQQVPGFSSAQFANVNERLAALEASPALNVQASSLPVGLTSPITEAATPDNPDSASWAQRRKDIADAMPAQDPTA